MKEFEIRPPDLMIEKRRLYLEDVKLFSKLKKDFKNFACPACLGEQNFRIFGKFNLDYVCCKNCRTIFLNPRPNFDQLCDYYANAKSYQFWAEKIFPISEEIRREKIFRPRVDLIKKKCLEYDVVCPSMLEIGPGIGTFSEEASRSSFFGDISVIEPTSYLANKCKEKRLDTYEGYFENSEVNKTFDVITFFEVLEHVANPLLFLSKCEKLLRPNGLLVMTCPNSEGFDVMILEALSDQVDIERFNMFNFDSIEILLNKAGFVVTEKTTPGKLDVDIVRNKIDSGDFLVDKNRFYEYIFKTKFDKIKDNLQKFIVDNNMSSNMQIVARKLVQ